MLGFCELYALSCAGLISAGYTMWHQAAKYTVVNFGQTAGMPVFPCVQAHQPVAYKVECWLT